MDAISKLLFAFLTLIVGIVLLGTISTSVLGVNSVTNVVNETIDVSHALAENGVGTGVVNTTYPFVVAHYPTDWKVQDCPLTSVVIRNFTNSDLTLNTDYTLYPANGTWYLKGTTVNVTKLRGAGGGGTTGNNTYVSYSYCGDDYMNLQWGRSVLSVAVGMFALGLLCVSVGLFFSIARDYGIV
jgi:hypothetical protein